MSRQSRCSTPFGITEVGTIGRVFSVEQNRIVLNAFRHHRGGHISAASSGLAPWLCSTPFGITEVGTPVVERRAVLPLSAQRLSASQRWAQHLPTRKFRGTRVLNAFRHHRGGHCVTERYRVRCRSCAQRLSASQRWALGDQVILSQFMPECSTPFGITEVGTRPSSLSWRDRAMCSTPFGITEVGTG